jgi:glycolate oxidase FAD binding subunit
VTEAATLLRELERPVRPVGGGTKPWIDACGAESLETGEINRILEHNVGDFTTVLEAGVPFAEAQAAFGEHGQAIAWDPPDPGGATVGGIVATADSGPLRHRYTRCDGHHAGPSFGAEK